MPALPASSPAKPITPSPVLVSSPATGQVPQTQARPSIDDDLSVAFAPKIDPPKTGSSAKALDSSTKASGSSKPADPSATASDAGKPDSITTAAPSDEADDYLVGSTKPEETVVPKAAEPIPEVVPVKAPELRAAYAKVKARVVDLEKQLNEVKAKPVDDTERKTFTEQISTLNKKLEEVGATLKFAAYEQSEEYKQKYETPFIEAWNEGVQQVASLTITDEAGGTRKGTADDFQAVMRESDNEQAAQIASEMFGANAFYVLSSRRELQKLSNSRNKALSEYRSTMAERGKAEAENAIKAKTEADNRRIQQLAAFKALNEDAALKYPAFFAPVEGDDEGNKILEKGYKDADLAFQGGNGLTPEQLVRLHSAIRNRAAGFGRLAYKLKQNEAKIAELENILKDLRESTPGHGQVSRGEPIKTELSFEDEFNAAARSGR